MEQLKYEIEDSVIAELLGVENFSSDESAILELVKNAYDASALKVTLTFCDDSIIIEDNGIGMNENDIKKHWMHIGISDKGYAIYDKNKNKRIQAGSKGIGRFALARLGRKISLISKKEDAQAIIWTTDWESSNIESFIADFVGTKIEIASLREKWTEKKIEVLIRYLSRSYNDTAMKIEVNHYGRSESIDKFFGNPLVGINCKSEIKFRYNKGRLQVRIYSDEFDDRAGEYYKGNIKELYKEVDMYEELNGSEYLQLLKEDLKTKLYEIGDFDANIFFNFSANKNDKEKFFYKYLNTIDKFESGIILYRNAFSISSYEGNKDWLELSKRVRKSPAAASHITGKWRVRENQLSGYVEIDKDNNEKLVELSNRQGFDENIYYKLFIKILHSGLNVFESYRQDIIRKIDKKNKKKNANIPLIEKIEKNYKNAIGLTDDNAKILQFELSQMLDNEKENQQELKNALERYNYDTRVLNSLATIGIKGTANAHELRADRNKLDNYNFIVEALKKYNLWDEITSKERTKYLDEDIPKLLLTWKDASLKIKEFADNFLVDISKKAFNSKDIDICELLLKKKETWEKNYSALTVRISCKNSEKYFIPEDVVNVIFDNLLLNSLQINDKNTDLEIFIEIELDNEKLKVSYSDNGVGLTNKYLKEPFRILEPLETSRVDGHGLGMWIINNTINISGGEVIDIPIGYGFNFIFTIGRGI
jgi:signal transduction histidine kinase